MKERKDKDMTPPARGKERIVKTVSRRGEGLRRFKPI